MDEPWFCYMLECSDASFYVGITNNLPERLPVKLVWKQAYSSQQEARKTEREIKGWSRRKKWELIQKHQATKR